MKQTKRDAKIERARRRQQEKYRYYVPNGKVESFIEMVGNDTHFINLFIAANGVGKTACMANLLANMCFKPINQEYFDYPLFTDFPYLKRGRIISTPTALTSTIIPELKKWFPQGEYTTSKGGKNYESRWKTSTGFSFDILTFEQAVEEFESVTLGFVFIDEVCPQSIFKATIARMRRGGIIIDVFTPLSGSSYYYDAFVATKRNMV